MSIDGWARRCKHMVETHLGENFRDHEIWLRADRGDIEWKEARRLLGLSEKPEVINGRRVAGVSEVEGTRGTPFYYNGPKDYTPAEAEAWRTAGKIAAELDKSFARWVVELVYKEVTDPPLPVFSKTRQADFDAAIRRHQRALDIKFEEEVRKKLLEATAERLAWMEEREADAEQIIAAHNGIMTQEQYNLLMKLTHPDSNPSAEVKTEVFRLLRERKAALVSEKEKSKSGPPLPTAAEMRARSARY